MAIFCSAKAANRSGLTQALGPLFSRMADLIDRKAVRGALTAVLVVAVVLFGPLAFLLLGFASREPAFLLIAVGGWAGLVGASCRVWLGPRFFLLHPWLRIVLAGCLAAGTAAAKWPGLTQALALRRVVFSQLHYAMRVLLAARRTSLVN